MDDVLDLIASDASASEISDKIKDILYDKASSKIDGIRANVGAFIFDRDWETNLIRRPFKLL